MAANGEELRKLVKNKLGLNDTCCGHSWDSIDDLLFEVVYQESNPEELEKGMRNHE